MGKGRLEAFTDGVIAIIITIMVLEIKVPPGADLAALLSSLPILSTYALSFLNVGIFWNNHHHMLHATVRVDGRVLWANLFLLFWLSLIPFVINWIDNTGFEDRCRSRPTGSFSRWRLSATICCRKPYSRATAGARHSRRPSAMTSRGKFQWSSMLSAVRSRSCAHG
jgi:Endosomal/lysosomal potassium channel TMEM175